jgi:uncharacterized lipoprotein YajG
MKRLALVAAVLAIAACTTQEETPAVDTSAPAMSPAPVDTAMRMDTAMKMDTGMKMDTTAKKP